MYYYRIFLRSDFMMNHDTLLFQVLSISLHQRYQDQLPRKRNVNEDLAKIENHYNRRAMFVQFSKHIISYVHATLLCNVAFVLEERGRYEYGVMYIARAESPVTLTRDRER